MKIYIMGICGTAMSHVALLLQQMGHVVCGADQHFFDPIAKLLKDHQITTYTGYDSQRLCEIKPDVVIVGNVISRGNEEIEFLLNSRQFPFYSFPSFLEEHLFSKRNMWVVTGTHGKTTTTSLIAYLLKSVCNPGYLIGGLPQNFTHGCSLGDGNAPFVIEGDEYDTAFFDKRSKFFHYAPRTLIINNLEFDHADIFRDLQEVQRTFYQLTRIVPSNGRIIINGDTDTVKALLPCNWTQVVTVGFQSTNDWQIQNLQENALDINFVLHASSKNVQHLISAPLLGEFNARNIAMACVACFENDLDIDLNCLKNFRGIQRRQKILLKTNTFILMEDFGHHATALHVTLQALKQHYPQYKIIACFEPACNTSASVYFQEKATFAFEKADEVWLLPPKTHLYSDRFVNVLQSLQVETLATSLTTSGHKVTQIDTYETLLNKIRDLSKSTEPTLVCCFSNGRLSEALEHL